MQSLVPNSILFVCMYTLTLGGPGGGGGVLGNGRQGNGARDNNLNKWIDLAESQLMVKWCKLFTQPTI